jgi:hypothetical protein
MNKRRLLQIAAAALCLGTSCIVSDQLTTFTILPDGSADWVRFQSNIRSTEKGDKGAEELKRFVEEFTAQQDEDCMRIRPNQIHLQICSINDASIRMSRVALMRF